MLLPRFFRFTERAESERKIARIILEAGLNEVPPTLARVTLPGDTRRLRGIPAIGRGVAGVSPGTHPTDVVRRMRDH